METSGGGKTLGKAGLPDTARRRKGVSLAAHSPLNHHNSNFFGTVTAGGIITHLLTNRLEDDGVTIRAAVGYVTRGITHNG